MREAIEDCLVTIEECEKLIKRLSKEVTDTLRAMKVRLTSIQTELGNSASSGEGLGEGVAAQEVKRCIVSLRCPDCGGNLHPEGCLVKEDGVWNVVDGGRCEACRRLWPLKVLRAKQRGA